MKMFYKIAAVALVIVGFSATANAQSTENTNASAQILAPITIVGDGVLNFGGFTAIAGTVTMSFDGGRDSDGPDLVAAFGGTVPSFVVEGDVDATYAITLPGSITLTNDTDFLTVDSFVTSIGETGTLNGLGEQTFSVGATLNVVGAESPGNYVGDFDVTVDYN